MAVHHKRGATKYRVSNPGLASLLFVNGRGRGAGKRAPNRASRMDVIAHAERLGLLRGAQARKARRSRNAPKAGLFARAKRAAAKALSSLRPKKARKRAAPKKTTKEKDMRTNRKRRKNKKNRRRPNATTTRRRRNAAKRPVARKTKRRKARKANAAKRTRRTTKRRKARKANARPRRSNARRTRRSSARRTRRAMTRRAAPKRRNYARRVVGGRRRSFGPTWRFNPAALAPIRTRRYRRRNTSAAGTATETLKGAPGLLLQGANVGGGYLLTALFSGFTDRISQGKMGRFNGLVASLGAMVIAAFVPDNYLAPLKIVNKKTLTIGIGLYGLTQLLKLVLPSSWRDRLGVSGLNEYVNLPGTPPAWTATGSLGGLNEYVNVGMPGGQGQDAQTAAGLQLVGQNPVFLADSMLTADASKTRVDSMMGLNEYIQWGPGSPAQAAAGLGDYAPNMPESAGLWWGNGAYPTSGYPSAPASRWLAYGAMLRGLGMAQADFPEAALSAGPPARPEFAAPAMPVPALPVAMSPAMPMMPPGCGPYMPGPMAQAIPAPQMPMPAGMPDDGCGIPANCLPYGNPALQAGLPIMAYAPPALPTIPGCSPVDVMGTFNDPNRTILGQPF